MSSNVKTAIFWLVLIGVAVLLYSVIKSDKAEPRELAFNEFVSLVEDGSVQSVTVSGTQVRGRMSGVGGAEFRSSLPPSYDRIYDLLREKKVALTFSDPPSGGGWGSILTTWAPFFIMLLFWVFMMRQMNRGGSKALDFGKSRARLHTTQQKKVTFEEVAGAGEAKTSLVELVEFLREPRRWQEMGAKPPKGCLLVGPPGCGKTLLARALAGEANVPFFDISGAEFVEMFVGVGAARVRDLFSTGKKNAPCVLFIDEIDAVGRKRGSGVGGGHDEREQTLNQLLVEMDGFENKEGVIVVAATNRADVLDKALIRPGRFDRQIQVPLPDAGERCDILRIHVRKKPLADDVDLGLLAHQTPGYGGADLANLTNEAAIQAVRRFDRDGHVDGRVVTMEDFRRALEMIRSGRQIFSNLDLVLIESATQLAQPMERLFVRLSLNDGQKAEGELLWADSSFIKYRSAMDGSEIILPKHGVWKFEAMSEI